MKRYIFILAVGFFFLLGTGCAIRSDEKNQAVEIQEIKRSFQKIDEHSVEPSIASGTIHEFVSLLNKYDISTDAISGISTNLHVMDQGNIKLIQYIQPPELYGNSGKNSWLIVKYKNIASLIQKEVPYNLVTFKTKRIEDSTYLYTFSYNFQVNIHGIVAQRYKLDQPPAEENAIQLHTLPKNLFKFDEETVYYRDNRSLIIDTVSDDLATMQWSILDDSGKLKTKIHFMMNEKNFFDFIGTN